MANSLKACASMVMSIDRIVSLVPATRVLVTSCIVIVGGIFLSCPKSF